MKTFKYTGSQPHNISKRIKNAEGKEEIADIRLAKGDIMQLDENDPITKTLVANGLLQEEQLTYMPIKDTSKNK